MPQEVKDIIIDSIEKLLKIHDIEKAKLVNDFLTLTLEEKDPNDEIIGQDGNGKPLTRGMLLERIRKSEEALEKGQIISQEEAIKIAENW